MMLTICTDYGNHECPESVRRRLWDAMTISGNFDRRFRISRAGERYYRLVESSLRRKWEDAV